MFFFFNDVMYEKIKIKKCLERTFNSVFLLLGDTNRVSERITQLDSVFLIFTFAKRYCSSDFETRLVNGIND